MKPKSHGLLMPLLLDGKKDSLNDTAQPRSEEPCE